MKGDPPDTITRPKTLLCHESPHGGNQAALATEIRNRLPEIELVVSSSYQESKAEIRDSEIVITRSLPTGLLDVAMELSFVQAMNAGVDSYDIERFEREQIIFANASGVHAIPIAEQVLWYLLLFERRIPDGIQRQARNEWRHFAGRELHGSTIGEIVSARSVRRSLDWPLRSVLALSEPNATRMSISRESTGL